MNIPLAPPSIAEDTALARRIVAGERAAFDALYEAYFPRIHAYARRRTRDAAEAEDWTQDALLAVLRGLGSYRGDAPLGAWIFAIVRRVVSHGRRGPSGTEPLDEAAHAAAPDCGPLARVHARGLLGRVDDGLRRVSASSRRIFMLRFAEDLSIAEIAQRTGVSEDAVKTTLSRTRRRLADGLGPRARATV